ncbi:MAG: YlmC/YmxH family sporulation protein [Clostridia bacterium]|nr:YlmC/YmxH family sporulation protein [Clostridia bacterium]
MARTTLSDFKHKDVINVNCGANLGCVYDIEFDPCNGVICAIIVPGRAKFCKWIRCSEELVIPFCKICKVGDDVILVDVDV